MLRSAGLAIGVFAISICGGLVARADDAPTKGPAPAMAKARLADSGELVILHTDVVPEQVAETKKVVVTEFRTEIVGGRSVARAVEVPREIVVNTTKYTEKEVEKKIAKDAFHVRDIDGKELSSDALAKSLTKEKPVLFIYGKKPLDPFYADFFKPGTLVVYLHEAPPEKPQVALPAPVRGKAIPLRAVPLPAIPVPAVPDRIPEAPPKD